MYIYHVLNFNTSSLKNETTLKTTGISFISFTSFCFLAQHHNSGHHQGGHSHAIVLDDTSTFVKSIRGLFIVLALSIHELFEGFAVGLESESSSVWLMFGAVSAHKLVIAFCIGMELVATGTTFLLSVIYVFTFAVVSPLGIGIGIAITGNEGNDTGVASVILQGLASGTLLYVVFFEVLQGGRKSGLRQCLSVVFGYALMFGIICIMNLFGKLLVSTLLLYFYKTNKTDYRTLLFNLEVFVKF